MRNREGEKGDRERRKAKIGMDRAGKVGEADDDRHSNLVVAGVRLRRRAALLSLPAAALVAGRWRMTAG